MEKTHARMIALFCALFYASTALAAPELKQTSTSTLSREERYRQSAVYFKGIADLTDAKYTAEKKVSDARGTTIEAQKLVIDANKVPRTVIVKEIPGEMWAGVAIALVVVFSAGLYVGFDMTRDRAPSP